MKCKIYILTSHQQDFLIGPTFCFWYERKKNRESFTQSCYYQGTFLCDYCWFWICITTCIKSELMFNEDWSWRLYILDNLSICNVRVDLFFLFVLSRIPNFFLFFFLVNVKSSKTLLTCSGGIVRWDLPMFTLQKRASIL